jgi:signal transduction histidine kinase
MAKKILLGLALVLMVANVLATLDLPNQQPRLPVPLIDVRGAPVVEQAGPGVGGGLASGDRILAVDGVSVPTRDFLSFLLDGYRVGNRVQLIVERGGQSIRLDMALVRSVQPGLLVINSVVAFLVWLFGLFVLLKGAAELSSRLVYGMSMTLSTLMFVYWPENTFGLSAGPYLGWALSNGFYPLTMALLLHFTLVFPEGMLRPWQRRLVPVVYPLSILTSVALTWTLARARATLAPVDLALYQDAFLFLRLYLALFFLVGLASLVHNYLRSTQLATRQKLKWLFWGITLGIAPQILLYELPAGLGFGHLIPEEVSYLFVLFGPAGFVIAMLRYRLLDVDVVINRSIVYSVVTAFVVCAYLFLVGLGDWLATSLWGGGETGVRVIVVVLLAAAFAPVRSTAQRLVDRMFFRTQHDQRLALMEYSRRLSRIIDIRELLTYMVGLINRVIPVTFIQVFVKDNKTDDLREIYPASPENPERGLLSTRCLAEVGLHEKPIAILTGERPAELDKCGILLPLRVERRLVGMLCLGDKRSGQPYAEEDVGFLAAVAAQTAMAFEHARAFQQIRDLNLGLEQKVFERTQQLAEANDRLAEQYARLQRLDEMKEALTGMIIHDLKNPVGTILLGLEFVDQGELEKLPENVQSALSIITRTARDMQDLISNLLEVTRMEAGQLQLKREPVCVRELFEEGERRVQMLAKSRNVSLALASGGEQQLGVDRQLVTRVLVNLLTNAVKYAPRNSEVGVRALLQDRPLGACSLQVTNRGPVIPPEYREKLFDKYVSSDRSKIAGFAGTGLGLVFCKLVVEAHGGRIEVESPPEGQPDGARFKVVLPTSPVEPSVPIRRSEG